MILILKEFVKYSTDISIIVHLNTCFCTTICIISIHIAAQIGYGFLMGYSSGFCLKKVSSLLDIVYVVLSVSKRFVGMY